jgi:hypothetical protein
MEDQLHAGGIVIVNVRMFQIIHKGASLMVQSGAMFSESKGKLVPVLLNKYAPPVPYLSECRGFSTRDSRIQVHR